MGTSNPPRSSAATTIALALVLALLAPVARVLFPRLYLLGEDASFATVGLLALVVYSAPILALAFTRLPPRAATWLGAILLSGARLGVQFVHPVPTWLPVGATAAALLGTTCVILGLGGLRSLRALPLALVAGLALDTAARIPTGSWEPVWQGGPAPTAVALGTVVATGIAAAVAMRAPAENHPGVGGVAICATGPFLMLQLVFLQNLGSLGSSVPVSFPVAIAIVLTGDVLALGAVVLTGTYGERLRIGPAVVLAVAAVVIASALPRLEGPSAVLAVLVLQVVVATCLSIVAARPEAATGSRAVLSATLAALGFLALALLWQLHIDRPLPFPRAALPALAGLWLGISVVASVAQRPMRRMIDRPAFAGAALLVAASVVVGATTAMAWPRPLDAHEGGAEVTIVSFNVRGSLGEDGMLDADAIVRSIAAADPDVVLLQEVGRGWPIFGQYDLLARLAQRLRLPYRFEAAADPQFGNAILSRLPMTPVAAGPLPEVEGSQGRSFLAVRVDTFRGPLLVTDAHLESDAAEQIDAMLAAVGDETPAVLGGDLNMEVADTANIGRFLSVGLIDAEGSFADPCRTTSAAPTSACDRPDWVWVTSDLRIVAFEIGTPTASDHLPVIVTVAMPRG